MNILSTTPNNEYQLMDGTSMATPHVAGVAALALSVNNTLTVDELKELLLLHDERRSIPEGHRAGSQRDVQHRCPLDAGLRRQRRAGRERRACHRRRDRVHA
jgi:hypothetical protein